MNKELAAVRKREKTKKHREAKRNHEKMLKLHERIANKKEQAELDSKAQPKFKKTKAEAEAKTKAMEANVIYSSRTDITKELEAKIAKEKEDDDKRSNQIL